ncbi:MAG: iron-sulfur cluster assembly protein [Thermoplasmata archaeon]|nr:iron-sulfur cluster assembly protein [Thermoplasmata archaeon]MCI4358879.1 iron-sulfur cluster assembly protein [Thermoplasmata archaeon]
MNGADSGEVKVAAADATVPKPATAGLTGGVYADREQAVLENLKKIYDPEIPMNIVDLGLIYGFDWSGDDVTLHMTLTAPGCPVAGILAEEVKGAIEKVEHIHAATVDMVWEPPWTPERMSDFAKRQFGYL